MADTRPHADDPDAAAALARLRAHFQAMPPVAALHLSIAGYDGTRLQLAAPLGAHVNDKGCAFGGSLGSLLTLAGWGLLQLRLESAGIEADIFVAESRVRFLAPLHEDLVAVAAPAQDADLAGFLAAVAGRGRAGIAVQGHVPLVAGGEAATMEARYVAIRR